MNVNSTNENVIWPERKLSPSFHRTSRTKFTNPVNGGPINGMQRVMEEILTLERVFLNNGIDCFMMFRKWISAVCEMRIVNIRILRCIRKIPISSSRGGTMKNACIPEISGIARTRLIVSRLSDLKTLTIPPSVSDAPMFFIRFMYSTARIPPICMLVNDAVIVLVVSILPISNTTSSMGVIRKKIIFRK